MTIDELIDDSHARACRKGWWEGVDLDDPNVIAAKLALVHSEISEALEEVRGAEALPVWRYENGKPEGFAIELADAVIRIADLCGALDIDLQDAIRIKAEYNETRPMRHGGKKL